MDLTRIPEIQVVRNVPPDALLGGIVACGGVEEYYNYILQEQKTERDRLRSLSAASGMRVATPYPENAHEVVEAAVTEIATKPLTLTQEFIAAGLVTPLPNWWAIPSLRRDRIGQAGRAHRSMVPDSRGERFVLDRNGVSWPVFCTWANFDFNLRELAVGERVGTPLDVSHSQWATYMVQEANEDQIINGLTDEQGSAATIDGMSAPGLLSSDVTFTYSTWTGLTGAQILAEVKSAIELIRLTHPNIPLTLFIPGNYSDVMGNDYSTNYTGTIIQRLQQLGPYGGRNLRVVVADTLPDDRVILVAMDKRVVDLVIGQQPVPISWKDGPGWRTFWVVLDCVIFRMFADKNGNTGVAVGVLE